MIQNEQIAHIHPHILWAFFILGYLMHILAISYLTVKSSVNPAKDIWGYLVQKWPPLLVRLFIVTLGFLFWKFHPTEINKIAQHYANYLAPGELHDLVISVGLSLNPFTAGAYGYIGDSLLDKLLGFTPWFKNVVPPLAAPADPAKG